MHPRLPVQLLFLVTLCLALNMVIGVVTHVYLLILVAFTVGALQGCFYTSFIFLALAKTDLPCDLNLHFLERELVLNLMLMAQVLGKAILHVAVHLVFGEFKP